MDKPEDQRRWACFALPVLYGDRLAVNAIHEDLRFTEAMTAAVCAEIDDLAAWLGLEVATA